jgi:iron complex transport system substrate-binding protein
VNSVWTSIAGILALFAVTAASEQDSLRIISLAPHISELVFDAGAGDMLVGAVEYSDFPEQAKQVPRIGDAFRLDRERVASLAPDLILAWNGGTPQTVINQLRSDGFTVQVLDGSEPEDVAAALQEIGRLTGHSEEADRIAQDFLKRLDELRERFVGKSLVSVFVQIAPRPLYTVNGRQMIGKVIDLCAGRNIFADLEDLAPIVSEETILAANPQVIFATGEAGDDVFGRWRRFTSMDAVVNERLFHLDPDLVARPTLRLVDGALEVCERLDEARGN